MNQLMDQLKALAHETRFEIINLLLHKSICVQALARQIGISEGAVSQHLKILREAGLVMGEKKGYWTHYQVKKDALMQMASDLQSMVTQPVCLSQTCEHQSETTTGCCRKE